MRYPRKNSRRLLVLALAAGSLVVAWGIPWEQVRAADAPKGPSAPAAKATGAEPTPYPHVTLSTWYRVDPGWPRRPENVPWGRTPGVTVDRNDHVWIFTRVDPPVQVYTAEGKFLRAWGGDLIATTPTGMSSHQIKIDHEGMIWLADTGNHVILRCTPEGKLLKTLGTPGEPGCDETHLNKPTDMAVARDGDVFVTDGYGNNRVVHFDSQGRFVEEWGRLGTGPGEFSLPHAVVLDSRDRLYVADRNNARIQVFDRSGRFLAQWQNLIVPWGFWITPEDEIWVCGSSPMAWREEDANLGCPPKDQVFMKFDTSGRVLQLWTVPKGEDGQEQPGELNWVHGIALDSKGNIYATDIIGERAQKFVRQNGG
jgi:streptogramin lyase